MKMIFNITKSSSIYETFAPLYKVLKLLGIIPFRLNLKSGEVGIKFADLLWMCFMWLFWTGLIATNVLIGAREPGESSIIVLNGWHWMLMVQLLASFFIQMINFYKRKSIERLLRILNEFDLMNSQMKLKENHSACKSFFVEIMIASFTIYIALSTLTQISLAVILPADDTFDKLLQGAYCYVSISYILTYLLFFFALSNIKSRFRLINMNLVSFFGSHHTLSYVEEPPYYSPESSQVNFIRKVAIMHDKLNDAVEVVNYSLTYELLPGMVFTALTTIFTSFGAFRAINTRSVLTFVPAFLNVVWSSFYLLFLIAAIYIADTTTKSANDTLKTTSSIINNSNDEALLDKLSIFAQQIKSRTTTVSCGLFTIDWTLAFSMLSAATTYLFIILQFEMSKEPAVE